MVEKVSEPQVCLNQIEIYISPDKIYSMQMDCQNQKTNGKNLSTEEVFEIIDLCFEQIIEIFDDLPETVRNAIIVALEKIEDPNGKKQKSYGIFAWIK